MNDSKKCELESTQSDELLKQFFSFFPPVSFISGKREKNRKRKKEEKESRNLHLFPIFIPVVEQFKPQLTSVKRYNEKKGAAIFFYIFFLHPSRKREKEERERRKREKEEREK